MGCSGNQWNGIATQELLTNLSLMQQSHAEVILHSVNALDVILDAAKVIRKAVTAEDLPLIEGQLGSPVYSSMDEILQSLDAIDTAISNGVAALDVAMQETAQAYGEDGSAACAAVIYRQ